MQFSMVFMRARRVFSSDREGFGVFWSPEAVGWCLVWDIISLAFLKQENVRIYFYSFPSRINTLHMLLNHIIRHKFKTLNSVQYPNSFLYRPAIQPNIAVHPYSNFKTVRFT